MKRGITLLLLGALSFVAFASVARAGGWAVVTLDTMPTNVVVDQPITVAMTIRQHGRTPWNCSDCVRVRGFHATGETFVVNAAKDGNGHYSATLNFNKAGRWQWAVASGLMPEWQTMPDIEVVNSAQDEALLVRANEMKNAASTPPVPLPAMGLLAVGVLGFIASGGGLIYWWRPRR